MSDASEVEIEMGSLSAEDEQLKGDDEGGGGDGEGGVGVFSPLLLVVSIVGVGTNLGSIAIFMRQKFRKDFHRLLIILAAYDLLVSRSLLARLTSSATSFVVGERERED